MTYEHPAQTSGPRPAATLPWNRSDTDKVVAGVCGGVGRRLGLDPVILRILVVILAFFGGAGALLYAAAWLLMPIDRTGHSVLEEAFSSTTQNRTRSVLLGAALVLVLVIATAGVFDGGLVPGLLVALVICGLLLLVRRDQASSGYPYAAPEGPPRYGPARSGPAYAPTAGPAPYGTSEVPIAAPAVYGTTPFAHPSPQETTMTSSPGSDPTLTMPRPEPRYGEPVGPAYPSYGPPYEPPREPPPTSYAPPPVPPQARRQRSYLGLLTISVIMVAMGVLAIVDSADYYVPAAGYVATALGITALGLLVGARYGRSRALIALGIVLCVALAPAAVANEVTSGNWQNWGDAQDVSLRPLSAADLEPSYEYGAGTFRLDLTELDGMTRDVSTRIEIDAGEVLVILPRDLDVRINADTGVGELDVLDRQSSGLGLSQSVDDPGADGNGGGTLNLNIHLGLGNVEVRRAAS